MMKVSDPIIFGHVMEVFFKDVFAKHGDTLTKWELVPTMAWKAYWKRSRNYPEHERETIEKDIQQAFEEGPEVAMVNSDKGITNLHVPSDVIIDASMPAMIRTSGKMYNPKGELQDTKAVIPDSSYAGIYEATIDFCKKHGAFDPRTMGTVPNVGLMAQKAEEYGSHDKTFEIKEKGIVKVIDTYSKKTLLEHRVSTGDVWRMCQVKDLPIQDWIKLAVSRARATQTPTIFWLDSERAHDRELIKKVDQYLPLEDTTGLDIKILSPTEATRVTLQRLKRRKGYYFRYRKRITRLFDRPFSNSGSRDQRQNAIYRSFDERWWFI